MIYKLSLKAFPKEGFQKYNKLVQTSTSKDHTNLNVYLLSQAHHLLTFSVLSVDIIKRKILEHKTWFTNLS